MITACVALVRLSCASPLETYSGYVPPRTYPLPCDEAHLRAAQALKANGYEIAEVERTATGGLVVGVRESAREERMEMRLACAASGVDLVVSGDTPYAENGMRIAFARVVSLRAENERRPKRLEVEAELLPHAETKLHFSGSLEPFGVVALRVAVVNGSSRVLHVSPTAIRMRDVSGHLEDPLEATEVERRVATALPDLRSRLLAEVRLAPGESTRGFVLYRSARYEGAILSIVDVETNEPEEFLISFPRRGS